MLNILLLNMSGIVVGYTNFHFCVMVVIVWQLDLQLPMQSVPIASKVVSSNFPPPIKVTATI